jgi:hypothetical protein
MDGCSYSFSFMEPKKYRSLYDDKGNRPHFLGNISAGRIRSILGLGL